MPLTEKGAKVVKASCGDELAHKLGRGDAGVVVTPGEGKADMGPGHKANHVGKEGEYHWPVDDAASPLKRAEAKYDEDKLLSSISAHCDALNDRLDSLADCDEEIRNGKKDKK